MAVIGVTSLLSGMTVRDTSDDTVFTVSYVEPISNGRYCVVTNKHNKYIYDAWDKFEILK